MDDLVFLLPFLHLLLSYKLEGIFWLPFRTLPFPGSPVKKTLEYFLFKSAFYTGAELISGNYIKNAYLEFRIISNMRYMSLAFTSTNKDCLVNLIISSSKSNDNPQPKKYFHTVFQ